MLLRALRAPKFLKTLWLRFLLADGGQRDLWRSVKNGCPKWNPAKWNQVSGCRFESEKPQGLQLLRNLRVLLGGVRVEHLLRLAFSLLLELLPTCWVGGWPVWRSSVPQQLVPLLTPFLFGRGPLLK